MIALLVGAIAFTVGMIVGAAGIARWYFWRLDQPGVAREAIKAMYRRSHPHWLQVSKNDPTRVCPCCGWNETEGLASKDKCVPAKPEAKPES